MGGIIFYASFFFLLLGFGLGGPKAAETFAGSESGLGASFSTVSLGVGVVAPGVSVRPSGVGVGAPGVNEGVGPPGVGPPGVVPGSPAVKPAPSYGWLVLSERGSPTFSIQIKLTLVFKL